MSNEDGAVKQKILRILFPFKGEMIPSLYYKYAWQGIFILAFLHAVFFWSAAQTPGVFLGTPEALLKSIGSGALFSIWSTLGIWFYPYMAVIGKSAIHS